MKAVVRLLALAIALPAASQEARLEFDPQVGMTGTRVTITSPLPKGAVVRFGSRVVPLLVEPGRRPSFLVPEGVSSAFVEASLDGRQIARSVVPFIVAGASVAGVQKLVGLREAIDVFGYSDPTPEGGTRPESRARRVLSLGDGDVLTIGESAAPGPLPFVITNDAASAALHGMGSPAFLLTARPPTRRVIILPAPPPVPTPTPTPTPTPAPAAAPSGPQG